MADPLSCIIPSLNMFRTTQFLHPLTRVYSPTLLRSHFWHSHFPPHFTGGTDCWALSAIVELHLFACWSDSCARIYNVHNAA